MVGNATQKSNSSHKDVVILICNTSSCFAVGAKGGRRWMCIVGARWYMLHVLVALKDHKKMKKNIYNSYEYKSVESERSGKRSEAKRRWERVVKTQLVRNSLQFHHVLVLLSCPTPFVNGLHSLPFMGGGTKRAKQLDWDSICCMQEWWRCA